jgi:hypothetical protein
MAWALTVPILSHLNDKDHEWMNDIAQIRRVQFLTLTLRLDLTIIRFLYIVPPYVR